MSLNPYPKLIVDLDNLISKYVNAVERIKLGQKTPPSPDKLNEEDLPKAKEILEHAAKEDDLDPNFGAQLIILRCLFKNYNKTKE